MFILFCFIVRVVNLWVTTLDFLVGLTLPGDRIQRFIEWDFVVNLQNLAICPICCLELKKEKLHSYG